MCSEIVCSYPPSSETWGLCAARSGPECCEDAGTLEPVLNSSVGAETQNQQNVINTDIKQCMSTLAPKGTVHSKMSVLLSFTHPRVIPNLYDWLRNIFWRMLVTVLVPINFHCILVHKMEIYLVTNILQNIFYCVPQTNSYRFGRTWGWVNGDNIFLFGWKIS